MSQSTLAQAHSAVQTILYWLYAVAIVVVWLTL